MKKSEEEVVFSSFSTSQDYYQINKEELFNSFSSGSLNLKDLIDLEELQKLFELQYKFTGLPIGLLDRDNNILIRIGWQKLCMDFHRVNKQTEKLCIESDSYIKENLLNEGYTGYKCKMGLWDYAVPVKVADFHLGTLFFGQFFFDDQKVDDEFYVKQAGKYSFPVRDYLGALRKVPRISRSRLQEIMDYYVKLVDFITGQAKNNLILKLEITKRKKIEESLRQKNLENEWLVQNIPQKIFYKDASLHYVLCNASYAADLGINKDEVKGKNDYDFYPDELAEKYRKDDLRIINTGIPEEFEEAYRKNGRQIFVRTKKIPVKDSEGQIIGIYGIFADITEERNLIRKLEEQRDFLNSIYDGANLPMFVIEVKENGNYVYEGINKAFERLAGIRNQDIIGRSPDNLDVLDKKVKKAIRARYDKCVRSGESYTYQQMIPLRGRETHWLTTLTPLKNHNEKIYRIVGTSIFINDLIEVQKELEEHKNNLENLVRERTGKLEESQKRLSKAIEVSPYPLMIHAEDGKVIQISDSWTELSGYHPEDIPTMEAWYRKAYGADKNSLDREMKVIYALKSKIHEGEYKVRCKSGKQLIWDFTSTPIGKLADGRKAILSMANDITKIREEEKEKEKAYSILNERMKEITCLFELNNLYRHQNESVFDMLTESTEIIRKSLQFPEKTHVEIVFDEVVYHSKNFKKSEYFIDENIEIEEKQRGKITICISQGEEEGFQATFLKEEKDLLREIAFNLGHYINKIEFEQRLAKSEEKFRTIIKESPLPKVIINIDNKIELVNNSFTRLLGYSLEDVPDIEKWWETAYPDPEYRNKVINQWNKVFRETITESYAAHLPEVIIHCKDGQDRIFSITGNRIANQMVVVFNDLTERVKAEEELQISLRELKRSNEELEQFAYVASHDLQQPLRMVASYTQLLEKKYKDKIDEKANMYIHYAVDGASRMQTLINDLLSYSRITTRGEDFIEVDCNRIIKNVLHSLSIRIKETHAKISIDLLPVIKADPAQLERVFMNLIENAIKFSGENKPIINIFAENKNKSWYFTIQDEGIGIDPKFKDKVFVIFQRLHGQDVYKGTGIGLSICKRIINRHGGEIWFNSEPGKGTKFIFTVPSFE